MFNKPGNMKKIVYLLYFVQINNGTYLFTFRGILPKKVCWRLKRITLNIFLESVIKVVVVLKEVCKFFDSSPFQRQYLIPLPGNVGRT